MSLTAQEKAGALDHLNTFLRFPSVSTDPNHKQDLRACADWLVNFLLDIGFDAKAYETAGHPCVVGTWCKKPDKPTVFIYGHYDVQPPDPLDLWQTPAFEPNVREGYIYARGASDDKGQVMCHLWALKMMMDKDGELPVNVKIMIEGEEEIGSMNLLPFVKAHKDLLQADVGLVSDTPMISEDMPSICLSLRGLAYLEVTLKATSHDLHSGQQGGVVQNPINAMAKLISKLKGSDHQVRIPGFYDDVRPITPEIEKMLQQIPADEDALKTELGTSELVGEEDYGILARKWYRPTLDCNGIIGGFTGEGAKTVIPAEASAKFSMRLVADQNPEQIVALTKQFLRAVQPDGVEMTIIEHGHGLPYAIAPDHPAITTAAAAMKKAFGKEVVLAGEGGSIPILADMNKELGLEFVLMGFNLPNDNIHAPNERFKLDCFYHGIEAVITFLKTYS